MAINDLTVIIILSHNKKNDVLECLKSITEMEYKNYRVIVVENGSMDGSAEAIRSKYPLVHLVESRINIGVAGGRNLGISYADNNFDYKFLLFLDDDIILDKCTLSEMVESYHRTKGAGIITPKCYLMNLPGVIGYAGGMSVNLFSGKIMDIGNGQKDSGQFDKSGFIPSSGGICLVSKDVIRKIGTFDEKFNPYGWEDVDYSIRAKAEGYKIFYNHKAIVFHKGGKKGRGSSIPVYEYSKAKNYFYLINKHANLLQRMSISSVLPFRILMMISRELFKGEFKIVAAQLNGFIKLFRKNEIS